MLNKMSRSKAPAVKADLHDIRQAETRAAAEADIQPFGEKYDTKYGGATACFRKVLLAFFDFRPSTGISLAHRKPHRERLRHRQRYWLIPSMPAVIKREIAAAV